PESPFGGFSRDRKPQVRGGENDGDEARDREAHERRVVARDRAHDGVRPTSPPAGGSRWSRVQNPEVKRSLARAWRARISGSSCSPTAVRHRKSHVGTSARK